jgi:cyclopropane fatty-acyl-phospholipid synthase-like methyltransferase
MFRRIFYFFSYFGKPPWDTGISPPELLDFLHNHPSGKALDLGCGTGTNTITMARHGWSVTGIDFMSKAIRQARRKTQQAGLQINYQVDDVTQFNPLTGPFDLILDMGCFHNLTAQAKKVYQSKLSQWLAPEATFLLYGFLSSDSEAGFGISSADLTSFSTFLNLVSRTDSMDRSHPSTWLQYISPEKDL